MSGEDNNIIELAQQLSELKGIVVQGFKGVHQRQDIANGRTAKIEIRLEKVEKRDNIQDGIKKGIMSSWGFLTTLVIACSGIIGAVAYWKH